MDSERPPFISNASDRLLQVLAEHAPEEPDDVVVAQFLEARVLPKRKKNFLNLPKEKQIYVALFDRLPKEALLDIDANREKYNPPQPSGPSDQKGNFRYALGSHEIESTLHALELFTGKKVSDR